MKQILAFIVLLLSPTSVYAIDAWRGWFQYEDNFQFPPLTAQFGVMTTNGSIDKAPLVSINEYAPIDVPFDFVEPWYQTFLFQRSEGWRYRMQFDNQWVTDRTNFIDPHIVGNDALLYDHMVLSYWLLRQTNSVGQPIGSVVIIPTIKTAPSAQHVAFHWGAVPEPTSLTLISILLYFLKLALNRGLNSYAFQTHRG